MSKPCLVQLSMKYEDGFLYRRMKLDHKCYHGIFNSIISIYKHPFIEIIDNYPKGTSSTETSVHNDVIISDFGYTVYGLWFVQKTLIILHFLSISFGPILLEYMINIKSMLSPWLTV